MKKILVYLPVLMILLTAQLFGQVSQTAVPFLLIAPGARPGGMGETFVAIADDATATHWNPAGLGRYPLSPDWLKLKTGQDRQIEKIALVENNMPETNYKKYDVWAIIDGQLARWDDSAWETYTRFNLKGGRSIKSILQRYTGLDEEQIEPYFQRLAQHNNSFPTEKINSLEQQVQAQVPEDYQYADEINNGFERLREAWGDLKLSANGFMNFERMVNQSLEDGQMTKTELDSVAFGFNNIVMKRVLDRINIPYGVVLKSDVNCLESHGGMIYAGTDDGFFRFDPKRNKWRSYGLEDSLPSLEITALAKYRRKSIIIGTGAGILYYDGAKIKTYSEDKNAPTEKITAIAAASERNIWAATENDLYHYDGRTWKNHSSHEVSLGEDIDKIAQSFYGDIALTDKEGLAGEIKSLNGLQDDLTVGETIKLPYKAAIRGEVLSLATMGDLIWIGTQRGVILSSGSGFTHYGYKVYEAENDISVMEIADMFAPDSDHDKIDLLAQMIKQYNNLEADIVKSGESVMVYANALGAPVYSIAAASRNKAFIGTAYGVVEYDNGMWSRFPKLELAQDPAHTIKTESGEVWFATDDNVYIEAKAKKHFTFMHSNYLVQLADDLYYEFFSFVYPTGEWGTFGLGFTFLSFGSQNRTGEYGEDLGSFNSYDMAITLSYGTKIMENLSAGLSARYINSHLADVGAGREKGKGVGFSFAIDGGLLYDINRRATFAATVTNIGPEIAYIDADQADPLPRKLSVAMAYKIVNSPFNRLTAIGEASKLLVDLNDDLNTEINEIIPHVGLEYWYSNYLSVRTGYIYDDVGSQKYFTVGASLQYNILRFDFSYVPSSDEKFNRMGNTMRFSMNVSF
ncbi:MAG: PorV/PorQ family protein [candidate division Zixibacteria bacterium]|nr:PorV/PorQ family protein [candidate division Zixibacteria bacterium]